MAVYSIVPIQHVMSVFSSIGRRDQRGSVDYIRHLYWYIIPFFIHVGIGPFLNSGKGNKMFYAPNSDISQLCGVLSKLLSGSS